ncbi:hypothetical protein PR202_ga30670 [Eleusine coracana subsp. coracana]|uniref:Uncharacterized protein n=1 Tax=Eleusine coracana subsp. coracana TaxID=191504 RepID=A0AAV5DQE4_ELECO|nr:hypothetical protein PR202_ga30670 [Eleusine coracana subsp. coracana]
MSPPLPTGRLLRYPIVDLCLSRGRIPSPRGLHSLVPRPAARPAGHLQGRALPVACDRPASPAAGCA